MADGRQRYDTQDIESFGGLLGNYEHKTEFPDNASPYVKNFIMEEGSLENRKGYLRVNSTAYTGGILFLVPYKNRDNTSFLLLGVI